MTTNANDITLWLSGGASNINANLSLGGDPSIFPVTSNVLNNLFDDVSADEALNGDENYRCIYIFNDGDTKIWNVKLFIQSDLENGAVIELGIYDRNESQRLTITGASPSTTGKLVLSYANKSFDLLYNSNIGTMASALQSALEALVKNEETGETFFKNVTVTAQGTAETNIFDIKWDGKDAKRSFESILLATGGNQLVPATTVGLSTIQNGSPINTIAGEIGTESTPPGGVGFFAATSESPISIPFLGPDDALPIWIKRSVIAGTNAVENDNFVLRIRVESLEPIA
jgi:hypothetical protein